MPPAKPLAIAFRKACFKETLKVFERDRKENTQQKSESSTGQEESPQPAGLMGREVASATFLRSLLRHGRWSVLEAIIESVGDRSDLQAICQAELGRSRQPRRVRFTPLTEFSRWLRGSDDINATSGTDHSSHARSAKRGGPPAHVLHFPHPPEPRFAWARQRYAPHSIALSGVTHTLCSPLGLDMLWQSIISPFEPYDRLISTSTAVTRMIRACGDVMTDYMVDRLGGTLDSSLKTKITVEQLPLGVDTNEHRVATPEQRAEVRHQLGIDDSTSSEAIAILFVGRISHHAKAQPYPLLVAAQHAAEQFKEKKIHLIFSGWFANEHVRLALESSVRRIAPSVQLHLVDGLDTWWRHRVWDAADIFVSLADSIQETFGLTNLEAMSRGLPVVATDWNGYRDTVADGLTGFLIPTHMVRESTSDATAELLLGSINYDQFLARIGQTVGVSTTDACQRISQLISDASLRNRFGQAGRERILGRFDWATVIGLYDTMWKQQRDQRAVHQRAELQTSVAISTDLTSSRAGTSSLDAKNATLDAVAIRGGVPHAQSISPAKYPPVQHTFEGYPTEWLDGRTHVTAASSSRSRVIGIIGDRMLNHSPGDPADGGRLTEVSEIRSLLSLFDQGLSIAEAQSKWFSTQNEHGHIEEIHSFRSTVAWMLKYDLLQVVASSNVATAESKHSHAKPRLSFVTTCKGRLNDLKNTLPRMVEQSGCEVVVVDYNCPEGTGDWVKENYPSVVLVRVPDAQVFDRSDAKNRGIDASSSEWTCLIDADVELEPDFVNSVSPMLRPGYFFRSSHPGEGTGGTFICLREDIDRVGGHDTVFQGWGEEDDDLIDSLRFSGLTSERFPASLIRHRDHTDDARTQFHTDEDRRHSHMVNRIYRSSKWDLARLSGVVPPIEQRRALYQLVSDQVRGLIADGKPGVIRLDTGGMRWTPVASTSRRVLEYTVAPSATDTSGTYEPSHQPKS